MPLNTAFHHTFVMKLFDRSVDLAQFPVQTPLYPVCRAWMKNDPHNTNMAPRLRTPTPEPEENLQNGEDENATEEDDASSEKMAKTTDPDFYKLPPPEPLKVTEKGLEESIRVPKFEKEILTKDFEVKVIQLNINFYLQLQGSVIIVIIQPHKLLVFADWGQQ